MTDEDFAQIAHLAGNLTGIVLGNHKRNMVYSRIARRVRAHGFSDFRQYLDYLENNMEAESSEFINSLTTNLTSFFREEHHFSFLKETLFPQLRFANKDRKRLRIWSAGCSIGQEAYSIAMTLRQVGFPSDWDIKILATDLDSNVLDTGRSGVYPASDVEGLYPPLVKRFFLKSRDERSVQVKDEIRNLVYFKRLNLLESWPIKGPFDIIFCRNVVIYFNKDTQRVLFDRYADLLPAGGHLMIGHSENLSGVTDRFESLGNTIYRKIK
ncbi:MAG: protein-glutamate O-methyltransferase [Saccharospirillaceae bacterium]|nr:protein-glutamate O-methyltransferase [Saccharospirillaceae bacterium]MCD8530982.1 protein-glutamate O-methyltransferase [Saccharospirillaceae bacterium]